VKECCLSENYVSALLKNFGMPLGEHCTSNYCD